MSALSFTINALWLPDLEQKFPRVSAGLIVALCPCKAVSGVLAASVAGDQRGEDLLHELESRLPPEQLHQARAGVQILRPAPDTRMSAVAILP